MLVYILECENNKYYIGKTDNLEKRLDAHRNGTVSWTKKYPIVKIIDTIHNSDDFDEDKYTKIYMKKYGVENVRGGSYCQIKLPKQKLDMLTIELRIDSCFSCGKTGHFIKQCNKKRVRNQYYSSSTKLLKALNRL